MRSVCAFVRGLPPARPPDAEAYAVVCVAYELVCVAYARLYEVCLQRVHLMRKRMRWCA
jgi:hypothetical protein